MKVGQILKNIFKETKLPPVEIELILAYVLGKSREFLLAHPETELNKLQIINYKLLIARRTKGEPTAYLIGHKEFYGLDFIVNKSVLIPRPETEMMVEEAINLTTRISHCSKRTPSPWQGEGWGEVGGGKVRTVDNQPHPALSLPRRGENILIIDVGTGSGCIIISLAKIINQKVIIKNLKFIATDISYSALNVARQNAKVHNVQNKIKFLQGDLIVPIYKYLNNPKNYIIITANLPYLTPSQIKKSPSIKYEPRLALSAGNDGLKYYRHLFKQIKMLDVMRYVLCEIDPSQKNKIKKFIHDELPNAQVEIKKDLHGHDRLIIIKI